MIITLCTPCEDGVCTGCTDEATLAGTPVGCGCKFWGHRADIRMRLYLLAEASAIVGITLPEARHALNLAPGIHGALAELVLAGALVRLSQTRKGWVVYVTAPDVRGRQIATQGVDNKQEGTDMSDEQDTTVGTVSIEWAEVMQPRISALCAAKSILGEEQVGGGPLSHPTKTRPTVDDLLRLAVYVETGIVLNDALSRKVSTGE